MDDRTLRQEEIEFILSATIEPDHFGPGQGRLDNWKFARAIENAVRAKSAARIAELETALRPFAAESKSDYEGWPDTYNPIFSKFTVGDLRRAAAALGEGARHANT